MLCWINDEQRVPTPQPEMPPPEEDLNHPPADGWNNPPPAKENWSNSPVPEPDMPPAEGSIVHQRWYQYLYLVLLWHIQRRDWFDALLPRKFPPKFLGHVWSFWKGPNVLIMTIRSPHVYPRPDIHWNGEPSTLGFPMTEKDLTYYKTLRCWPYDYQTNGFLFLKRNIAKFSLTCKKIVRNKLKLCNESHQEILYSKGKLVASLFRRIHVRQHGFSSLFTFVSVTL